MLIHCEVFSYVSLRSFLRYLYLIFHINPFPPFHLKLTYLFFIFKMVKEWIKAIIFKIIRKVDHQLFFKHLFFIVLTHNHFSFALTNLYFQDFLMIRQFLKNFLIFFPILQIFLASFFSYI